MGLGVTPLASRHPTCSIEQVFAKIKHWMRMAQARTVDAINNHIAKLVAGIPASECANYLNNAGYASI